MTKPSGKTVALVVAAGRGLRAGTMTPKQYTPLLGQSLLFRTLDALVRHPAIDAVTVVIHADDRDLYTQATRGLDLSPPVVGGESRQDSVLNGLESLVDMGVDRVLIHDAARPFLSPALIDRLLARLKTADGVIPAVAVVDSLKRVVDGVVVGAEDREGLFRVQTPQAFRFDPILAAHRATQDQNFTDDAAVMEANAGVVAVVDGEEGNFKVTTPNDFARAEGALLLRHADLRTGLGFDVHRFDDAQDQESGITLCGVVIPHDRALAGHSDADVALHALTDALLGATGKGDIGDHFPPSDERWRGAASSLFVDHARNLITEAGGIITHVDLTIICEAPKISPHKPAMKETIAHLLRIGTDRVSVKATTTEKLGFTGRGEGIAAQAVATVRLKAQG